MSPKKDLLEARFHFMCCVQSGNLKERERRMAYTHTELEENQAETSSITGSSGLGTE